MATSEGTLATPFPSSLRGAVGDEAIQAASSAMVCRRFGLLRCTRNDNDGDGQR